VVIMTARRPANVVRPTSLLAGVIHVIDAVLLPSS
jgi:hypothetical protein